MAVIRVPFCAIAELWPPFMLDEKFSEPNGVKSVIFDTGRLHVAIKQQMVDVPEIGPVEMCVYSVVGNIPYICAAYPVIRSGPLFDVLQRTATFSSLKGNTAASLADTLPSEALGWISASGCAQVNASVGGTCTLSDAPQIESVTVENLSVTNNLATALFTEYPAAGEGEEAKRIVRWRGSFVINTSE